MPGNPELLACPWCAAKARTYIAFPQSETPWHIDVEHGARQTVRFLRGATASE